MRPRHKAAEYMITASGSCSRSVCFNEAAA